ncbi:PepSY-associated TM helix domain-containing protein [Candidimonas nitroreducens]|uniref:Peptidase n=1 Tax=Candidimonas nitroreducens TaxID=683354 RepID=A0A225M859_9BURK|nr:PepSY-associated TM helix domain-containing protein [Candidimonas nitroreducens]OWT55741.1 hypothetical protein CEY11_20250 [Candidimonas nitroreducens]
MSALIATRRLYFVHKWSSLICTVFLLFLCITGLPLIFKDQIAALTNTDPPFAQVDAGTPRVSLDKLADDAHARYPGQVITSFLIDDDEPQVIVYMTPSWKTFLGPGSKNHSLKFDAHSGALLNDSTVPANPGSAFMKLVRDLHTDIFLDLPGALFLAVMGLLFVAAIVSGVLLYGPFMKKLDFGTVRAGRSKRIKWLDLHNLLGIVLAVWTLVVGATGVMNELSTPLFKYWNRTEVQAMLAPYKGHPVPVRKDWVSPEQVFNTTVQALPGHTVMLLFPPGNPFGSPYHYLAWAKGDTPLTSRLFTPVLIDALTGQITDKVKMPPYLRLLEVSRPLHFGDYGGMPLKILWVLLDLSTIVVLVSGLYLWLKRRSVRERRLAVPSLQPSSVNQG